MCARESTIAAALCVCVCNIIKMVDVLCGRGGRDVEGEIEDLFDKLFMVKVSQYVSQFD